MNRSAKRAREGCPALKKYFDAPLWEFGLNNDLCGMILHLVILLLLGAFSQAVHLGQAVGTSHNNVRAIDTGLMSILNEIPKCAVGSYGLLAAFRTVNSLLCS